MTSILKVVKEGKEYDLTYLCKKYDKFLVDISDSRELKMIDTIKNDNEVTNYLCDLVIFIYFFVCVPEFEKMFTIEEDNVLYIMFMEILELIVSLKSILNSGVILAGKVIIRSIDERILNLKIFFSQIGEAPRRIKKYKDYAIFSEYKDLSDRRNRAFKGNNLGFTEEYFNEYIRKLDGQIADLKPYYENVKNQFIHTKKNGKKTFVKWWQTIEEYKSINSVSKMLEELDTTRGVHSFLNLYGSGSVAVHGSLRNKADLSFFIKPEAENEYFRKTVETQVGLVSQGLYSVLQVMKNHYQGDKFLEDIEVFYGYCFKTESLIEKID